MTLTTFIHAGMIIGLLVSSLGCAATGLAYLVASLSARSETSYRQMTTVAFIAFAAGALCGLSGLSAIVFVL